MWVSGCVVRAQLGGRRVRAVPHPIATIMKMSRRVEYPKLGVDETRMNCHDTIPRKLDCTKPRRSGSSARTQRTRTPIATRKVTPQTYRCTSGSLSRVTPRDSVN